MSTSEQDNKNIKQYRQPTIKKFTKQTDKKDAVKFGTSEISKNKILSGQKAERVVIKFLTSLGIRAFDVADNSKYPYDIYIEDTRTGFEVKNILSGSFYISENEIRQIENNNTRLVLVHDNNILVSKPIEELTELKRIFRELREINQYIIDSYNGEYNNDDLRIAIKNENEEKIRNDFIKINNLTKEEIINLL